MPLSPAGLAWPLIGNLDKSLVQRQIVTDRVLPAGVAAVVDPGTPSPVTSHTGPKLTSSCGKIVKLRLEIISRLLLSDIICLYYTSPVQADNTR